MLRVILSVPLGVRVKPQAPIRLKPICCVRLRLKSETSGTSQPVSETSRALVLKGEPVSERNFTHFLALRVKDNVILEVIVKVHILLGLKSENSSTPGS